MGKNLQEVKIILPVAALFAAGFILSWHYDLALAVALYKPENLFARLMEAFGWLPSYLSAVFLFLLWAAGAKDNEGKRWRYPAGCVMAGVCLAGLFLACYHYLEKRFLADGVTDVCTWLWVTLWVALSVFLFWWVFHMPAWLRQKMNFVALAGSAYLVANQLLVNLLKNIWQRTRFDEMLAGADTGFEAFTSWLTPFGNGGSSFPSGHTANACGIFVLLVLCDVFPSWNRHRKLVGLLCWGYVALMAYSRLLMGRHFLSDTLAAAGILALLFFLMRRTNVYKQGVLAARNLPVGAPRKKGAGHAV